MDYVKRVFALIACLGLIGLTGCSGGSSNLGTVTGNVTVDGEPVERALVSFLPSTGRASMGWTDENGDYELAYLQDEMGAVVGNHKVMIETKIVAEANYGASTYSEEGPVAKEKQDVRNTGRKEMLPKKYCNRNETELTAVVKKGENNFDWKLESK